MSFHKYSIFILLLSISGRTGNNVAGSVHYKVRAEVNKNSTQHTVQNVAEIKKIQVKIYYETLCPASVEFFTTELRPVLQTIPSYVNVQLVPYGHAMTKRRLGRYIFRCQHGPSECYGNKLHACVIHHVQNSTQAALVNICLMQNTYYQHNIGYNYGTALIWCSQQFLIPISEISRCVNSKQGSVLLKGFGEDTHQLKPRYVPYVTVNGSTEKQDDATRNLLETVCKMLPPNTTHHCL